MAWHCQILPYKFDKETAAIAKGEDRQELKILISVVVRDYDSLREMHERYLRFMKPENVDQEGEYLTEVTKRHSKLLRALEGDFADNPQKQKTS